MNTFNYTAMDNNTMNNTVNNTMNNGNMNNSQDNSYYNNSFIEQPPLSPMFGSSGSGLKRVVMEDDDDELYSDDDIMGDSLGREDRDDEPLFIQQHQKYSVSKGKQHAQSISYSENKRPDSLKLLNTPHHFSMDRYADAIIDDEDEEEEEEDEEENREDEEEDRDKENREEMFDYSGSMFAQLPENYSYYDTKYAQDYLYQFDDLDYFMDDFKFDEVKVEYEQQPQQPVEIMNSNEYSFGMGSHDGVPQSPLIKSTNPINLLHDKNALPIVEQQQNMLNRLSAQMSPFSRLTSASPSAANTSSSSTSSISSVSRKSPLVVDTRSNSTFMDIDMATPTTGTTNGSGNSHDNTNNALQTALDEQDEHELEPMGEEDSVHDDTGLETLEGGLESDEIHYCKMMNPTTGSPCGKTFSRPYDLVRHQKTIHSPQKKIFRCLFCIQGLGEQGYKKTFSRGDALSRHIKVKHNLTMDSDLLQNAMKYAKENVEYV